MDYEFTLVLDTDITLKVHASKDRTQLFFGKPDFVPTVDTGAIILKWCNEGTEFQSAFTVEDVLQAISSCNTNEELLSLYNTYPQYQQQLQAEFSKRRRDIILNSNSNQLIANPNGTYSNQ